MTAVLLCTTWNKGRMTAVLLCTTWNIKDERQLYFYVLRGIERMNDSGTVMYCSEYKGRMTAVLLGTPWNIKNE